MSSEELKKGLSRQFWYKWRSRLTFIWISGGWLFVTISKPWTAEGNWIDYGFDSLAWFCFAAGLTFRLWATLCIGGRKSGQVVDIGPYSVCRNPLYLGTFLMYLSQALFLKSAFFGLGLLVPWLAYWLAVIPAEEQHLQETFGEAYATYLRTVPRLWPKWSLYHSPERLDVDVRSVSKEFFRACGWLSMPLVAEAICLLRFEPSWPVLVTLF